MSVEEPWKNDVDYLIRELKLNICETNLQDIESKVSDIKEPDEQIIKALESLKLDFDTIQSRYCKTPDTDTTTTTNQKPVVMILTLTVTVFVILGFMYWYRRSTLTLNFGRLSFFVVLVVLTIIVWSFWKSYKELVDEQRVDDQRTPTDMNEIDSSKIIGLVMLVVTVIAMVYHLYTNPLTTLGSGTSIVIFAVIIIAFVIFIAMRLLLEWLNTSSVDDNIKEDTESYWQRLTSSVINLTQNQQIVVTLVVTVFLVLCLYFGMLKLGLMSQTTQKLIVMILVFAVVVTYAITRMSNVLFEYSSEVLYSILDLVMASILLWFVWGGINHVGSLSVIGFVMLFVMLALVSTIIKTYVLDTTDNIKPPENSGTPKESSPEVSPYDLYDRGIDHCTLGKSDRCKRLARESCESQPNKGIEQPCADIIYKGCMLPKPYEKPNQNCAVIARDECEAGLQKCRDCKGSDNPPEELFCKQCNEKSFTRCVEVRKMQCEKQSKCWNDDTEAFLRFLRKWRPDDYEKYWFLLKMNGITTEKQLHNTKTDNLLLRWPTSWGKQNSEEWTRLLKTLELLKSKASDRAHVML